MQARVEFCHRSEALVIKGYVSMIDLSSQGVVL